MKKFQNLRRKITIFLFLGISLMIMAFSCEDANNPPIKTCSYWTSPTMSLDQAQYLARHDLVIVDMENMTNNYNSLKLLKELNSSLKLICYANPMEFYKPMLSNRPLQKRYLQEIENNYEAWFLKDTDGSPVVYWGNMVMMNMSSNCYSYPLVGTYNQWMAKQIVKDVLSNAIWDGYFLDNGGGNISWVNSNIDYNRDGLKSLSIEIDNSWYNGLQSFLKDIRHSMHSNFILLANKGSLDFLPTLNGRMFEGFPNDYLGSTKDFGWHQSMSNAKAMEDQGLNYIIFQVEENNLSLGLASALLMDNVYLAVGQDNNRFNPILETDLGTAIGPYLQEGDNFVRYFSEGKVVVKPQYKIGEIFKTQNLAKN